jgi:SAM-dependent methyltransferase
VCGYGAIEFVRRSLCRAEVEGQSVIEVGSYDVNGSVRPDVEALHPRLYLGVDISPGPRVDELCSVYELEQRYGRDSFDVVISTEMVEHVRDWRAAVNNLKHILRPEGTLVVTTRSLGFPLHGWPKDYWRYETADFAVIFDDFEDVVVESDPEMPGVFVKATKPARFTARDLSDIALHSVARGGRTRRLTRIDDALLWLRFTRRRLRGESL